MQRKTKVIDFMGKKKMIACLACAIQKKEAELPGGVIASTKHFEAQPDFEYPIPGFVVLVAKRHMQSVDEFTPEERKDFIEFLCNVRKSMRKALNIQTIYLIQEEDTTSHFHVWLFPRYEWMEKQFGKKIESVKPIMKYAKEKLKTKENLEKVYAAIKKLKKLG